MRIENISIISKWTIAECQEMLARHGQHIADFDFTENLSDNPWGSDFLTVQSKRTKVWTDYPVHTDRNLAGYPVHGDNQWIAKFEEHLRTNYFGLVLRPRLRYKG